MTPREAILEMLEHDDSLALYCGRAVKLYEGWAISDEEARARLRQTLRGTAGRHFEIDWFPVLADIFARHSVPDMVSPLFYDARREAEYRLRDEARQMRTVRPAHESKRWEAG